MKTIDAHAHIVPPAIAEAVGSGNWHGVSFDLTPQGKLRGTCGDEQAVLPWPDFAESLDKRVALMDAERIDVHLLSLSPSIFWYHSSAADGVAYARAVNDSLADVVREVPDRFRALAYLPLQDPQASVVELTRCMQRPGFVGAVVGTNIDGRDWDAAELFPVLQAAELEGALVFFHPSRIRGQDFLNRYHLRNLVGNPMESAVTYASLAFGGVFDRLPELQTLFAHGGGFGSLGIGRFDHGYSVRPEAQKQAQQAPSEYLKRVYLDCLTHDPIALAGLIERVGAERIVVGTDYPADMGQRDPIAWLEANDRITSKQRREITGGNLAWVLQR